jgi:acetyltransferase-like isoleucine patch superfamily enzyme
VNLVGHFTASGIRRIQSRGTTAQLRRSGVRVGAGTRFTGRPIVVRAEGSELSLGERCSLISNARYTALAVNHPVVLRTLRSGAQLHIGNDVGISGGAIVAAYRIIIGDGCLIGANVTIADTDFHPVDKKDRRYAPMPLSTMDDAVCIDRGVFIGTNAVILRGSRIGEQAVVGAGSVVKGEVQPRQVVAGNPARAIRDITLLEGEHDQ